MQPRKHEQAATARILESGQQRKNIKKYNTKNGGLPQLFGVVLFNLCPLLHKLHILLHQLQARLCMLLNDVILVLEKAARQTNKGKKLRKRK